MSGAMQRFYGGYTPHMGGGRRAFLRLASAFFDRGAVLQGLTKAERRVLPKIGAIVRRKARRSLRPAAQKPLSAMTKEERAKYHWLAAIYAKKGLKLRRPGFPSAVGEPPRLQHPPTKENILRLIFFSADLSTHSVVIGPIAQGRRKVQEIERKRPFMGPALDEAVRKDHILSLWKDSVHA